jgi:hypothetical protein
MTREDKAGGADMARLNLSKRRKCYEWNYEEG